MHLTIAFSKLFVHLTVFFNLIHLPIYCENNYISICFHLTIMKTQVIFMRMNNFDLTRKTDLIDV